MIEFIPSGEIAASRNALNWFERLERVGGGASTWAETHRD